MTAFLTRSAAPAALFLTLGLAGGVVLRTTHGGPTETPAPEPPPPPAHTGPLIDLENPVCPIMGGNARESVATVWRGLRVRFCCRGCDDRFLADPATHLTELGIDYEPALAALERYEDSRGPEREAALADMRAAFTVVEPAPGDDQ